MNEYIDEFITYLRVERNYSNNTENNYLTDLEEFETYLKNKKINFKCIKYKDIAIYTKYLKEVQKLNSASINRHLSTLRSFYNYLLREEIIHSNPLKLVTGPKKGVKLPNYMKYSEFEKMIEVCDESPLGIRNRCLIEILFASGARIGELINLHVDAIDLERMQFKVLGKGNKERICYFGTPCKEALKNYLENSRSILLNGRQSDFLLINHIGGCLTTRGVRTIIDNIIKKSCIDTKVSPHTFRHTFATMLLNEGCDLKSVQELLGHVNLSTTSIYTHVTNDWIKEIYLHTHPRSKN